MRSKSGSKNKVKSQFQLNRKRDARAFAELVKRIGERRALESAGISPVWARKWKREHPRSKLKRSVPGRAASPEWGELGYEEYYVALMWEFNAQNSEAQADRDRAIADAAWAEYRRVVGTTV